MQITRFSSKLFQDFIFCHGYDVVKTIFVGVIGIWGIWKLCFILDSFLRKTKVEASIASFLCLSLKLTLKGILVLFCLSCLRLDISSVVAALGASVLTFGILFKDGLSNFINGLVLILSRPIRVGDYIEFESIKGEVAKIDVTFTTIKLQNENFAVIPNTRLVSNNIIRRSKSDICKLSFFVEFSELDQKIDVKKIVKRLIISNKRILNVPTYKLEYANIENEKAKLRVVVFCSRKHVEEAFLELTRNIEFTFKGLGLKAETSKI